MILVALLWSVWPWVLGALLVGAGLTAWDARRGRRDAWQTYLRLTPGLVIAGAVVAFIARGLLGTA